MMMRERASDVMVTTGPNSTVEIRVMRGSRTVDVCWYAYEKIQCQLDGLAVRFTRLDLSRWAIHYVRYGFGPDKVGMQCTCHGGISMEMCGRSPCKHMSCVQELVNREMLPFPE